MAEKAARRGPSPARLLTAATAALAPEPGEATVEAVAAAVQHIEQGLVLLREAAERLRGGARLPSVSGRSDATGGGVSSDGDRRLPSTSNHSGTGSSQTGHTLPSPRTKRKRPPQDAAAGAGTPSFSVAEGHATAGQESFAGLAAPGFAADSSFVPAMICGELDRGGRLSLASDDESRESGEEAAGSGSFLPKDVERRALAATAADREALAAFVKAHRGTIRGKTLESETRLPEVLRLVKFARWTAKMKDPGGIFFLVFDLLGIVTLFYEMVMLPVVLAWEMDVHGWLRTTSICTASFWTLDCLLGFFKGYYVEGALELRFKRVAARYIRSVFLMDALLVGSDWTNLALTSASSPGNNTDGAKIIRLARAAKALRLVAIFRIGRLARLVTDVLDMFLSAQARVMFKVCLIAGGALWFCHAMCCGWFALGNYMPSDTGTRWVDNIYIAAAGDPVPLSELSRGYQYFTAYHWALAQLSLGSMEVQPCTTWERIFTIVCMIIGLLCGTTLVSSLSATMVDVQMRHKERADRMRLLRQYLRENDVCPQLAAHIQWQAWQRLSQRTRLQGDEVLVLTMLPTRLQLQLHLEICAERVCSFGIFNLLRIVDDETFGLVCFSAVRAMHCIAGDVLFIQGVESQAAFAVLDGALCYNRAGGFSISGEAAAVEPGAMLCECALWALWKTMGTATATKACQLLEVNISELSRVIEQQPAGRVATVRVLMADYAAIFHRRILAALQTQAPVPDDLQVPGARAEHVLASFSRELRQLICFSTFRSLQKKGKSVSKSLQMHLQSEVGRGHVAVLSSAQGRICRIVPQVALRLEREDGRILVQVGRWRHSEAEPACRLPTVQRLGGEAASDALARLLQEELPLLGKHIRLPTECLACEWETEVESKKKFGALTTLSREVIRVATDVALDEIFDLAGRKVRRRLTGRHSSQDMPKSRTVSTMSTTHMLGKEASDLDRTVFWMRSPQEEDDVEDFVGEGYFFTWAEPSELQQWRRGDEIDSGLQAWVATLRPPRVEPRGSGGTDVLDILGASWMVQKFGNRTSHRGARRKAGGGFGGRSGRSEATEATEVPEVAMVDLSGDSASPRGGPDTTTMESVEENEERDVIYAC